MHDQSQILVVMAVYMLMVIGIGLFFARRANASSGNYFLGGRTLGPWVTAMSAEASDMSGWLLMGLPGVAYWMGFADAFWTALGLGIGTYLLWRLVSTRLRSYSAITADAITIPDFFSNRFHEKKKILMSISALFILVFFTVYASSCFVAVGKLFSSIFAIDYQACMIAGAVFVVIYTLVGGFLAESASDFMQALVMIAALVAILAVGIHTAGGPASVLANLRRIPGFLEFFGVATPAMAGGTQAVAGGRALFGATGQYSFLTILSIMSWGLGYFGMPQVLLRFMAIRDPRQLASSRRIAVTWCFISLFAAVVIGLVGRALYPAELLTPAAAENIFIVIATRLLPPALAGVAMAGILAATISSSDSYLLIASSAIAKNIYQGICRKEAGDRQVMRVSRLTLVAIAVTGMLIALDRDSVIFQVVSFAWAGFGATFGPVMLFSLFWKRTSYSGAIAGMVAGGAMVFAWKLLIRPLGGVFAIYELLPAFLFSCLAIALVSRLTARPSPEIEEEFERAKEKK
ncbi:MAG: sodium/proline symporter [Acidobacteria bacterium]|jgi:sodium/proline symporter|nr:sodium/proline symporter [Acidobacteriota bacterium]